MLPQDYINHPERKCCPATAAIIQYLKKRFRISWETKEHISQMLVQLNKEETDFLRKKIILSDEDKVQYVMV